MPADIAMFDVIVIFLAALIALGIVSMIIRLMMKPLVLVGVIAILGWVLYLNT